MRAILGGNERAGEQLTDRRHMRLLRCFGDVAIGAQTLREQPRLVQTPQEPGEAPAPDLYRFRTAHGLTREPRHIVYSLSGDLDLELPVFNSPGVEVVVLTTPRGAERLSARGAAARNLALIADSLGDPDGLLRAHRQLFAERGVRYLDCEGGETILGALRAARLLDEVFVTETDVPWMSPGTPASSRSSTASERARISSPRDGSDAGGSSAGGSTRDDAVAVTR